MTILMRMKYAFAALAIVFAPFASAAIVTVTVTGTVDSVAPELTAAGLGVTSGDSFSAIFSYDTNAVDASADPEFGNYGIQSFQLKVGSSGYDVFFFSQLLVINRPSVDEFDALAFASVPAGFGGYTFGSVSIILRGPDTIFSSDAIPGSVPAIGDFGSSSNDVSFSIAFTSPQNDVSFVSGTIGSISAVPLPAAAWLFGSAFLGLAAFRRRKSLPL